MTIAAISGASGLSASLIFLAITAASFFFSAGFLSGLLWVRRRQKWIAEYSDEFQC